MNLNLKELFESIQEEKINDVISNLKNCPELMDETNQNGIGPIHLCAQRGNIHLLKELIKNFKTNLNQRDNYGNTPLHFAAKYGHVSFLKELKDHGADITLENQGHQNVLDFLIHHEVELSISLFVELFGIECIQNFEVKIKK